MASLDRPEKPTRSGSSLELKLQIVSAVVLSALIIVFVIRSAGSAASASGTTSTSQPSRLVVAETVGRSVVIPKITLDAGIVRPPQPVATGPDRAARPTVGPMQTIEAAAARPAIPLAFVGGAVEPPLELERQRHERPDPGRPASTVRISSGFDCGTPIRVRQLSPTRFNVDVVTPGFRDWFMFRIEGAKGATLRIDLNGDDVLVRKNWGPLNPVYANSADLGDPALYRAASTPETTTAGWNGSALPSTRNQAWHYIPNCWMSDERTFSFVHAFDAETVTLAMRVPYSPSLNERVFERLRSDPRVRVVELFESTGGRPVWLADIGGDTRQGGREKPCVLIYAGEHPDEHDGMWAANGAITYLLGDDPAAKILRERYRFLVVPVLDPDAAAKGEHSNLISSFTVVSRSPESIACANWFSDWTDKGNRLDLVFDFHNVQSAESPTLFCVLGEGNGERGRAATQLNRVVTDRVRGEGYGCWPDVAERGWSPDRLGGWLSLNFAALTMTYEFNSQAKERHMSLDQFEAMGRSVAGGAGEFLASSQGISLMAAIDDDRRLRRTQRQTLKRPSSVDDSIVEQNLISAAIRRMAGPNDRYRENIVH